MIHTTVGVPHLPPVAAIAMGVATPLSPVAAHLHVDHHPPAVDHLRVGHHLPVAAQCALSLPTVTTMLAISVVARTTRLLLVVTTTTLPQEI
jgi:hypothetical protein